MSSEIWIIDNDIEDRDLISEIVSELNIPNKILFFDNGKAVLKRLEHEEAAPFIIICDVNLPGMDGFELREKLLAAPNRKHHSVPFIFWTNSAYENQIVKAFKLYAHGFFIKESRFEDWKSTFIQIIQYWTKSKMPPKKDHADAPMK